MYDGVIGKGGRWQTRKTYLTSWNIGKRSEGQKGAEVIVAKRGQVAVRS